MNLKFYVGKSPTLNNIRAVIAAQDINRFETIENCPVILIPKKEIKLVEDTILGWYNYEWNEEYECFVLGYGALINHSYNANTAFIKDFNNQSMNYVAYRDIKEGEEIFVNYNGDPEDKTPLPKEYTDYNY